MTPNHTQIPQAEHRPRRTRVSRKIPVPIFVPETKTEEPLPVALASDTGAPALPTKQSLRLTLLQRKGGASINKLMQATGWQPHSVRGFISGVLRKRLGLVVHSELLDGIRYYQIIAAA